MIREPDEVIIGTLSEVENLSGALSDQNGLVGELTTQESIEGSISEPQGLTGTIAQVEMIEGALTLPETVMAEIYQGAYTFTPGDSAIVIPTALRSLESNITIEPIPSNYGRIIWNGSEIHIV